MAEVIINNAATSNGAFSGGSPHQFTATGQPAVANAGQISGYLATGQDVVVTSTTGASQYSGISVNASVNGGMGAGSLELDTDDTVGIVAALVLTGTGSSLVLHGASSVIEPGGGSISANLLSVTSNGGVDLSDVGNTIATLGGLTAGANSVLRNESDLTISGAVNVGMHLQIIETGSLTETAGATLTARNATYTATGAITLLQQSQVSSLSLSAASGSVTLSGSTAVSSLLSVSAARASTASGAISGAGALQLTGGTLTLSATNTYTGGTTVTGGGVLVVSHANAFGIDALGSGAVTLDGGELRDGTGNGIGNAVVVGAGGGVLSGSGLPLNGAITGGGALTTTTDVGFSGDNSGFTGALNVASGYLEALSSHALSAGSAVTVAAGATLAIEVSETAGSLSGAGTVTSLSFGPSGTTDTLTTGGSGASTTFSGVIQESFPARLALSKAGSGVLTLSGANTYTGGTTVSAGVLRIGDGGTTGSIMGDVTDNAVLEFTRSDARTFTGAISGSGAVVVDGGGTQTLTLTGADTYTGGTTVSVGVLQIGNGGTTGSITGNVTDDATLEFSRSDATPFAGAISGSGKVVVDSGGVLTLSGANSYGGGTMVTGGATVSVAADANLGAAAGGVTLDGGVLAVSTGFNTTRTITVAAGGGTLSVGGNENLRENGTVTGPGGLVKTGGGSFALSSGSLSTPTVTVNAGLFRVGDFGPTAPTASGAFVDNAFLDFNNADVTGVTSVATGANGVTNFYGPVTGLAAVITNAGATTFRRLVNAGTSTITNTAGVTSFVANATPGQATLNATGGAFNFSGTTGPNGDGKISAASIAGTANGAFALGAVQLTAGSSNASTSVAGTISGTGGGLVKVGSGVLTLSGADTYTGATTVTGGVLAVDGSLTSAVTVANGATLRGTGMDSAGVTVQAGGTFAPGEGTGTFTAASLSQAGTFAETIGAGGAAGKLVTTGGAGVTILANATLSLAYGGGAEAYGTAYTIVQATGGGGVAGTFSNAANGATIVSGGHAFRVAYTANAVTLTDVTDTAPTVAAGQSFSAPENQTAVGQVQASDPDAGDRVAGYALAGSGADNALFTISAAGVLSFKAAPDYESTTHGPAYQVTVVASDTHGVSSAPTAVAVNVTDVNDAPALGGSGAMSIATDKGAATPLAAITVSDPDAGDVETATVTYTAANGTFAGLGAATAGANGATSYTVTGSAAQVQAALQGAVFTPTANQAAPGGSVTTTFTVADHDAAGLTAQPATATLTVTSVNDAPALGGSGAMSTATDKGAATPLAAITVSDPDAGDVETATVTYTAANGTFAGLGAATAGANGTTSYTVTGSAAQVQAALQGAVFTPTANQVAPGGTVTTTFTVADHDAAGLTAQPATATLTTTSVNDAPALGGSGAMSTATDKGAATPLAAITVSDPDAGDVETATVTYTAANGTFAGLGAASAGANGTTSYTVTGSAAQVQAALQAAVFTPTANQAAPGGSVTTTFTVADHDAAGLQAQPATATLAVTSVNDPPAVTGTHASTTDDRTADALFSGVSVSDPDVGQTETATISFTAANGALAGAGAATVAGGVATYTVSAGSASALAAALQAVTFKPTAQPIGTPSTATTVSLSVSDGAASTAADTGTVVTAIHTTNTPPAVAGTHASTTSDRAADALFSGVTVGDPDTGQTETATISFTAANGALSGAGPATVANGVATYTVSAGSAQALTTALQAVTFQPTTAPAGAANTSTTVTLSVSDGVVSTAADTGTVVTATHTTDTPPAIGGVPASASAPSGGAVVLAPGLTIADPDAGASALSASVAKTTGFIAGDVLTATPAAGITETYDAARGVLTLTGPASDTAYAQALRSVSFSHDGPVDAGARTVTFGVTDDAGVASSPASETVDVAGASPTGAGGGGAAGPTNLDAQLGFTIQFDNLVRATASDPGLSTPTSPLYALLQAEKAIAAQLDISQLGVADAQAQLYRLVDGTTSVAEISYAFFTGRTPTAAGLDYLVNSAANPTDLNDAYYARFSTENRYINFAANLATGAGAGAAAFQAAYGSLSLADATAKAYALVFGFAPAAGKVDAILNAQVSNGLGGTETRAQYFADITGGSAAAQKAAAIGFLLSDSVKEGFGTYQQADLHFLQDLAHGTAVFNVDLLAAYGTAPALVGQPVPDQTLTGG